MGASRSDLKQSAMRHVINQFLAEMDGVESDNEGVLILAATNAPWSVDPAFRRPGRFDRIIFVEPPDTAAKEEILNSLLQGKPVGEVDTKKVAQAASDYSGADLKALGLPADRIDWTAESAIGIGRLIKNNPRPIDLDGMKHFLDAAYRGDLNAAAQ